MYRGFQGQVPSDDMPEVLVSGASSGGQVLSRHGQMPHFGLRMEPAIVNATQNVEEEMIAMWDAPRTEWLVLFGTVFALICLDAAISRKLTRGQSENYKTHIVTVVIWILVGLGYNIYYSMRYGTDEGVEWFVGYALEWILSVDNLFAFQVILSSYRAPPAIQQKTLLVGVIGSIVTRGMLFCGIGAVFRSVHYIQFVFGLIIMYAGIRSLHEDDDDTEIVDNALVRMLKRCLGSRLMDSYDLEDLSLFVRDAGDGRWRATLLVPLIFCVIVADVIFAVDSVSAKVAQIHNQYIAYSSSVLALLGLRAMFFVVNDLVNYFELLKYGVCCILVFIGTELMFAGKFQLPEWLVLMVIVTVFNTCIVASIIKRFLLDASDGCYLSLTPGSKSLAKLGSESAPAEDTEQTPLLSAPVEETSPKDGSSEKEGSPSSPRKFDEKFFACQTEELRKKLQSRFEAIEGGRGEVPAASTRAAADSAAG